MNWNELWMTVFGTNHWLGLDLGFWVSMAVVALIVVAMNAVFWGYEAPEETDRPAQGGVTNDVIDKISRSFPCAQQRE